MSRHMEIRDAYGKLSNKANFYDGMITCSTLPGKVICRLVWNMGKKKTRRYQEYALAGIPRNCKGRILEVPVGTGVLTMPVYQDLPEAEATCLDYSAAMMATAKRRAAAMGLSNVRFVRGDVGNLPFADESFDLVLSLNGFHVFPDKEAAYREIFRVLRPGGIFTGCFYIHGENKRTDWLADHFYVPKGFFTPPFETVESLKKRLDAMFGKTSVRTVESVVCFTCRKVQAMKYQS